MKNVLGVLVNSVDKALHLTLLYDLHVPKSV